jgi:hypothetical protein
MYQSCIHISVLSLFGQEITNGLRSSPHSSDKIMTIHLQMYDTPSAGARYGKNGFICALRLFIDAGL